MTQLLAKIWADPFTYLGGAIMVMFAIGMLIRYGKYVWQEIINDED